MIYKMTKCPDKHKELCEHLQQISNNEVKKNKIDPVIGRNEELIALHLH